MSVGGGEGRDGGGGKEGGGRGVEMVREETCWAVILKVIYASIWYVSL